MWYDRDVILVLNRCRNGYCPRPFSNSLPGDGPVGLLLIFDFIAMCCDVDIPRIEVEEAFNGAINA